MKVNKRGREGRKEGVKVRVLVPPGASQHRKLVEQEALGTRRVCVLTALGFLGSDAPRVLTFLLGAALVCPLCPGVPQAWPGGGAFSPCTV